MRRSIVPGLVAAALAVTLAPGAAAADEPCSRYAATPQRVFHGDDFEYVHAAASAMYCPDDVYVRITACVEALAGDGWTEVGCRTSPGTYVTKYTQGGRGQALTFDVPCVSGSLRTHVWGGEGLEPAEWVSDIATVGCFGSGPPVDSTPPQTSIDSGPSGVIHEGSASFTFSSSEPGTFECRLDGSAWTGCGSPAAYTGLSDGDHVFQVRAKDRAGNTDPSPAGRSCTVETSPSPVPTPSPSPDPGQTPPGETPSSSDTTAPAVVVGSHRRIRVTRSGTVRLAIGPLAEDASATVTLVRRGRVLGHTELLVRAGHAATARISLSARARAALRRRGAMRVRAVIVLRDAADNAGAATIRLTLVRSCGGATACVR